MDQEYLYGLAPEHIQTCIQNQDFRKDLVRISLYALGGYGPVAHSNLSNVMTIYFAQECTQISDHLMNIRKENDYHLQINKNTLTAVFDEDTSYHLYNTAGIKEKDSCFLSPATYGTLFIKSMAKYDRQQKEICARSEMMLWPFLESKPYGEAIIPQLDALKESHTRISLQ